MIFQKRIPSGYWRGILSDPATALLADALEMQVKTISLPVGIFFQPGLKFFAILVRAFHSLAVTKPLALVIYEKLLPGTQLVNRLQDLNYRVQVVSDPTLLQRSAENDKPIIVLADLESRRSDVCRAIASLKQAPATQHIPVLAFASESARQLQDAAYSAGAAVVASEAAIVAHLAQFLDTALEIR